MRELAGRRALVTGGSRGIGAGIALALAEEGADVAITYEKAADRATDVVRAIKDHGRNGISIRADAADPRAVRRSVADTVDRFGGLDILVNNVGTARQGSFPEMSLENVDLLLHVNLRSAIVATQAAIPHLGDGGRIISIGSNLAERLPFGGLTLYALTKSALPAMTRGLARELGSRGITVNLIQPGAIDTELNPADGGELADLNRSLTPLGRYGTPADVGAVVVFLASSSASNVTGAVITSDGGFNA